MAVVKLEVQNKTFITARATPKRRYPSSNRDSAVEPTRVVDTSTEVMTDAVVLDELVEPAV